MEWVNITAKSLPEAIDLALDNLGVDESEAEIEILEEPRQGLFGRQRGNARIRARVKPKGSRPKVERGRSRRRSGAEGGAAGGGAREGAAAGAAGRSRSRGAGGGGRGRDEVRAESSNGSAEATAEETTGTRVTAADESTARSRGGRAAGGRGREGGGGGSGIGRSGGSDRQSSREPVEEASMEEVSSQLEAFLSGLSEAFGHDGRVTVTSEDDEGVLGMVEGRHGLMVGPKARTLDAIQELARVSVQRSAPSTIRIKVDVGRYRELRREALKAFALEAAAAVRLDGRERLLEPMSSADRKVVHDALSGEPGIETRSAGNEPHRRVVVLLAEGARAAAAPAQVDDAEETSATDETVETSANGSGSAEAADTSVDEAVDAGDDAWAEGPEDDAGSDDTEGETVER
ncbi:MAG: Jag N-terminal domain-containing protein [Acidimicrobiia bacterium]|nr:Jag N-terminal domain-containing protein [Acidimicrobiia bacterium]MDH5291713.1 Jag N-terminal domain-containing protein [Acidimicrobiia bacterium]